nr:MAG TPA: hypothetical protein [Caudoviricetes sp.]
MARPFNYPIWNINTKAGFLPTPLTVEKPLIRHNWLGEWKIT